MQSSFVRAEHLEYVVVEGEEEPGASRIALSPSAPAQLVVDASALVSRGTDDVQPAQSLHQLLLALHLFIASKQASKQASNKQASNKQATQHVTHHITHQRIWTMSCVSCSG